MSDKGLPGDTLRSLLAKEHISGRRLAREIGVDQMRVNRILTSSVGISPDTAARLGYYFGTSTLYWLQLQARHDAAVADEQLLPEIVKTITPHQDAPRASRAPKNPKAP